MPNPSYGPYLDALIASGAISPFNAPGMADTSNSGWTPPPVFQDANYVYQPQYSRSDNGGENGASAPTYFNSPGSVWRNDMADVHRPYGQMDSFLDPTTGQVTSQSIHENPQASDPMEKLILAGILAMAGGAGFNALGGGAAGGGLGAANGSWDILPEAIGGSGGGGTSVMGAAAASGAGDAASTFTLPSMSAELPSVAGSFTAPASLAAAGAGGGSASWLSNLLGPGASSLIGPAATLLGAVAGSQGQNNETTSRRQTDPRIDPYLWGDNGLVNMTQGLLHSQFPQNQQDAATLRNTAMGLLGTPLRGARFMPAR